MENINFIEGVNIIAKHMPPGAKRLYDIFAAKGEFSFGQVEWITDPNDKKRLNQLGWCEDEGWWTCYP